MPLLGPIDSTALFLSVVIGGVGLALFVYGKKAQRMPQLIAGLLYMVYPYFTPTATQTIVVGAIITAGLWAAIWLGY